MNAVLILSLCALVPMAAAVSCYEGGHGTTKVSKGHLACGLIFDVETGKSRAHSIGEHTHRMSTINAFNQVNKCDAFEDVKVCICYGTKCNKPITKEQYEENGYKLPFEDEEDN